MLAQQRYMHRWTKRERARETRIGCKKFNVRATKPQSINCCSQQISVFYWAYFYYIFNFVVVSTTTEHSAPLDTSPSPPTTTTTTTATITRCWKINWGARRLARFSTVKYIYLFVRVGKERLKMTKVKWKWHTWIFSHVQLCFFFRRAFLFFPAFKATFQHENCGWYTI